MFLSNDSQKKKLQSYQIQNHNFMSSPNQQRSKNSTTSGALPPLSNCFRNTVEFQFAQSGQLTGSNPPPTRVIAKETTAVKPGCGYRLSYEHALAVGRYTPDPSGAPVTKAVAPNRTTSAISVSEAEEAFRIGASGISRILVPPQSKTGSAAGVGSVGSNNGDDGDDDNNDSSSVEQQNSGNSGVVSRAALPSLMMMSGSNGSGDMTSLLTSMFRAASTSAGKPTTANSARSYNKPQEVLPPAAQQSKQKNTRTPPTDGAELQETVSHFVVAMPSNSSGTSSNGSALVTPPAALFFPISYDWPRRRPAPALSSPAERSAQEINRRDHAQWPPQSFPVPWLLTTLQASPELLLQYLLSRGLSVPRPQLSALQLKKYNPNTALLYRIGPGAVAFRVVSNAFEAAGMTYTPGGCADHIDYNEPIDWSNDNASDGKDGNHNDDVQNSNCKNRPPVASSSTSASWNILWAKRCDPIVLGAMNSFQKINHLPGSWAIGRKDSLHKHISSMQAQFGFDVFGAIAPKSFLYPVDVEALRRDVEMSVKDAADARREARLRRKRILEEKRMRKTRRLDSAANNNNNSSKSGDGGSGNRAGTDDNYDFAEEEEAEEENGEENEEDEEEEEEEEDDEEDPNLPGLYIVKPCASSCGNGIRVVRGMPRFPSNIADGSKQRNFVVQRYLEPYIVDRRKFDLRLYVVLTGINPLKIWLFDEGLLRFAAHKYTAQRNLDNPLVHLTNFSIGSAAAKKDGASSSTAAAAAGSDRADGGDACELKWTIADFKRHFISNRRGEAHVPSRFPADMPRAAVWAQVQRDIDEVVVKTVLSMESEVRAQCKAQCRDPTGRGCFEMFGCDVMLDWNLKPHIIEANIMPSLAAVMELDRAVKGRMLAHMLTLVGVVPFCRDKERVNPTPPLGAFVQEVAEDKGVNVNVNVNNNSGSGSSVGATTGTGPKFGDTVATTACASGVVEPMYTYTAPSSSSAAGGGAAAATSTKKAAAASTAGCDCRKPTPENPYHYCGGQNVPLLTDFSPSSPHLTDAERFMLAEAEGELVRAGGFRRVFPPSEDAHERYSHLFSEGLCRNTYLLVSHATEVARLKQQALLQVQGAASQQQQQCASSEDNDDDDNVVA